MSVRQIAILAFAIIAASSAKNEEKPTKRQLPVYFGPGTDNRGLDPRIALLGGDAAGRFVQVDPRTGEAVDPAQLQAFHPGIVSRDPQLRQPPQYNQLLRLINENLDGGQGSPQQLLQQNLASRRPQQFRGQPEPAPVSLTQEQIVQNQVQNAIATKGIREQEARDVQRSQQLELEQYLLQQRISPEYFRQLQVQPQLIQRPLRVDPRGEADSRQRQADVQARAQAEAQAAQAEAQARAQAEAQAETQERAQAEAQARAQAEAQARAQAEAQARAQAEAQARAQAEAQARAQAEAQARAQAEAHARAQADAQARAQAEAQARAQAEAQARSQTTANAEVQKRKHEEEEERAQEEQSRAIAATIAARAQLQSQPKAAGPQYILQQPQYESEPIPEAPERVSYSTIQFGSTKLPRPPRIFSSPPSGRQLIYQASHSAPQPSPLPEYVEIPQQQQEYKPKVDYSPNQPQAYRLAPLQPGIPSVVVKERQTPNQYLIETTNFDVQRQPTFRPQGSQIRVPQEVLAAHEVAEQRDRAIYLQQALEAAAPEVPSRSSIFVTTARTPVLKPRPQEQEVHQEGGRPLTQGELKALLNAGYQVRPKPQQPDYEDTVGVTYYQRGGRLGKRQDKPIPKPVPLTEEERRSLAREGIRGLYRIEPAGNEEGEHVKYVLALGKPLPSH